MVKALKNIAIAVLSIFISNAAFSQVKFEKVYGSTGYDYGYSVVQTYDKGYAALGSTSSFGSGNSDMYLIKTDSMGILQWQRAYGGINIDQGFSIKQTTDTGLVIAGYTNSSGYGGYDMYVIKTDKSGNILWTKTYGGTNWDFAYSVEQTTDGGYIIAGGTYSFGNGNEDMFLVKTDSNGDTLWTKTYGGLNEEEAASVTQTTDGGYILTGYSTSFGDVNGDFYTIKTSAAGDTLWTKIMGFNGMDKPTQIIQTIDGGYMSTGISENTAAGYNEAFIVKTDALGDTTFTKKFGSPNDAAAYSICQTTTGRYLWVGKLKIGSNYRVYLYKIDALGNWNFAYTFGGTGNNEGRSVKQTTDGGYIVVGNTTGFNNGLGDVYLFKTDSMGISSGTIANLATDIETTTLNNINSLRIFPNPTTNGNCKIMIQTNKENFSGKINLLSITGQLLISQELQQENHSSEIEIELNTSFISSGIYFIEVVTEDGRYTSKLSVENN